MIFAARKCTMMKSMPVLADVRASYHDYTLGESRTASGVLSTRDMIGLRVLTEY